MKVASPLRLDFIDSLKVIMMLCVLLNHVPQYVGIVTGDTIWEGLGGGVGVSGFVILSGFGLTYSLLSKKVSHIDPLPFFWRRVSRIVPLYYVALFTASWILEVVQPKNLLTHLLFIHTFFEDFSHTPGSLWFIGLIAQCYLAFPLLYRLMQQKNGKYWLTFAAIALYGLGLLLQHQGVYTSDSFLRFSLEFSLGMLLAANLSAKRSITLLQPAIVALALGGAVVYFGALQLSLVPGLPALAQATIRTVGGICSFMLITSLLLWLERQWQPMVRKMAPLIASLSFASYAAYLFHRPMLDIITDSPAWQRFTGYLSIGNQSKALVGSNALSHSPTFQLIYLFIISVPVIFFVGYWIQVAHDSIMKDLASSFSAKPLAEKPTPSSSSVR